LGRTKIFLGRRLDTPALRDQKSEKLDAMRWEFAYKKNRTTDLPIYQRIAPLLSWNFLAHFQFQLRHVPSLRITEINKKLKFFQNYPLLRYIKALRNYFCLRNNFENSRRSQYIILFKKIFSKNSK
jgi:hypothetical protein